MYNAYCFLNNSLVPSMFLIKRFIIAATNSSCLKQQPGMCTGLQQLVVVFTKERVLSVMNLQGTASSNCFFIQVVACSKHCGRIPATSINANATARNSTYISISADKQCAVTTKSSRILVAAAAKKYQVIINSILLAI